jgi:predicted Zn-dependent protease
MTHLRTEAELMSVLGHEIGHVTGRHSASQMSKQQLAMGGLIVGMMVEPELQRFGGLAQQGLGVLFLKFGRDHENEADELGLRYMTREEYDPREMIEVFGVLDRVGRAEGGAGRMPEWLSTHPNPGNRQTNIQEEIAKTGATGSVVNRDAYLRHLDGMVFGDNPREGYFVGQAFYHPDLRFQLAFPRGFKTQNQRQAVAGVSEGQDAMVALTLTAGSSPEEAARKFLSQQGLQAGRTGRDTIGGLPAHEAFFEVATEQGALRGQVAFVAYDSKIYRLLAYTSAARFASYQKAFDAAIRSFAPLREARYLDVQPKRIDLVTLDREMGLAEFARAYPSTVESATIGLINGVDANQPLARGLLAKRVVGGRLPD